MERLRAVSTEAVYWSRREKIGFLTLGVDLFGQGGDPDDHAAQRAQHEHDPRCEWCGETLNDCMKRSGCGFAIEA